jgi:hypothetical protein
MLLFENKTQWQFENTRFVCESREVV